MSTIPGSLARRTVFWMHLTCGVLAGVFILAMSVTGVLLTYERQIIDWRTAANRVTLLVGSAALSADELLAKVRPLAPAGARLQLVFRDDPAWPVTAQIGREALLLHPQTGEVLPDAAAGVRGFFETMERWHRRLGGESSSLRAQVLDLANLVFLFIIASGIYLWLPPVWKWHVLKARMLLRSHYVNSKARDFSWHYIFSFWMFLPLLLIAFSGAVFSYGWVNSLVFAAYGESPPLRQGPGGGSGSGSGGGGPGRGPGPGQGQGQVSAIGAAGPGARMSAVTSPSTEGPRASAQQLLDVARSTFVDWQTLTLPGEIRGAQVDLTAELRQPDAPRLPRQTLTLSSSDASVLRLAPPANAPGVQSPGQRARVWLRFIHTGEQYGVVGQTIAGIATLAACFLAYTGLALAWRRLILPWWRRRRVPDAMARGAP